MTIKEKIITLKSRILEGGGIGSLPNLCRSLCVSTISFISLFAITINILSLIFLQNYKLYFWLVAFLLTGISFYLFFKQKNHLALDRNLLLLNAGLLIFSLPFLFVADYMDFFRFVGLILAVIGVFLLFFGKRFKFADQFGVETASRPSPLVLKFYLPKFTTSSVLFALVIVGFLVNQYMMYRLNIVNNANIFSNSAGVNPNGEVLKKLTAFDVALAKERMDKNNDGICDVCGMPIQQCIDSGQIDCNMGNDSNAIGILGSQHIHADLKVYVNGQALDFAKPEYYMKSSVMHVDNNQNKEDAGSVLHQHAKKVPLWLFFRSIGMALSPDSIITTDGRILKNENGNTLKFYLNGKKVDELGDYSFQSLDKLLISYGPENDPTIQKQIDSVTDFAKNH